MAEPRTLTQIAGAPLTPSPLASSVLLVIDSAAQVHETALAEIAEIADGFNIVVQNAGVWL